MENYVVDSHTWLWFLTRNKNLSELGRQILRQAQGGEVRVFIPTIVLAEIANIIRKKKLELTIEEVLERIVRGDGFSVATFDLAVFQVMTTLPQSWDIHDKIIAATACFYEATLITRDEVLLNSDIVVTVWD
ncbi:MAG: PIN domain-containing protein [Oscillatoria sp. PMC 1068.18]|nr:PIN domain-containing protein [Oscillatoria sp. PMC 1076.18]MEC4988529.1 PIN domain-containing protein [Oscillatoria sp. PMC 1068.18]